MTMTLLQTQTPLDTWLPAPGEEFVKIADDPASAKLKGYYYDGRMRFEPMSTGERADAIPWGTQVIDLDLYPLPNLAIEISDISLADDLGEKRLQYEELGIPEYWIVNVQALQIIAFAVAIDRSIRRIHESQVLPGLKLEILHQALGRSLQENQSATTAWLMEQFRV
jgi:Uma2 family endonuclease